MYQEQSIVRISHLIISLILLLPFVTLSFSKLCDPYDENILLEIKKQFGNPSSLSSWDSSTDCCTNWEGIMSCDDNGHVTYLDLYVAQDVFGSLPLAIGDLTFLQTLFISNYISGPFPEVICKLDNLQALSVQRTNLTVPIPSCLGQFRNLSSLEIIFNDMITGPIPTAFAQLKTLEYLILDDNNFSGPIPSSLGQLASLRYLGLGSNQLSGSIPESLGYLPNLNSINLSKNQLSGSIPKSFGSFKEAMYIWLNGNNLSGPIPKTMSRIKAMTIDLSSNNLTGNALFLFGTNKPIHLIDLSNNHFKFNFSKVEFPLELFTMNISHNMIYGSLPEQMRQIHLQIIDVSYNQLCGPIPVRDDQLTWLKPEFFSHNKCLCGPPSDACK